MKIGRTRYRIVVTQDFDGVFWFRPEMKRGVFGSWVFGGNGGNSRYSESYQSKERAERRIEEWKEEVKKSKFRPKVVHIMDYDD